MGILQNNAKRVAQISLFNLVYIDAVISYLAVCYIVEAVDKVSDGSLSSSGGADKGNLLTGCCKKIHIVQYNFLRHISEIYIVKYHIALEFFVVHRAVSLMSMLPCP